MEEILDIYSKDGKYLGTKTREECHDKQPGFYHKPVWIWIINSKNEVLVQKRSSVKKSFPNYWDMSCAGHVEAGESFIRGAVRETAEELGVVTNEEDYVYAGEYISEEAWEIGQIYLLKIDIELENIKLQVEEVAEVKWLSFEEFKKLFYSQDFIPYDEEYKEMSIELIQKCIQV
jgi:isopentenyl-diphosphate delta-isomerase type 1